MLKVFRDNLKSLKWVLWAVILVFVLIVFVDFGGNLQGTAVAPSATAATVGDQVVSYSEFERAYRQREDLFRQTYGEQFDREAIRRLGLPLQVLNELVSERLLRQEAGRMGLDVTDEEIRAAVLELPVFQQDGKFIGWDAFESTLRSNRYTADEFWQLMRGDLLGTKVRQVLASNVYIPDSAIETDLRKRGETAKIRYFQVGADAFREDVEPDPAAAEAWFADHAELFRSPERRSVDYLTVDPAALQATMTVSEDELRAYYDSNVGQFSSEEQVRARHILLKVGPERSEDEARQQMTAIRSRIDSGEDFAALAAELSDDPGSKVKGGDLGFFGRGQMVAPFEQAAFGASAGTLVGPVKSGFGLHLIEVLEKRPGGQRPFEAAREEIRAQLLSDRAARLAESTAGELSDRIRREGGIEAMAAVAESTDGVSMASTEPFARDENVVGIGRSTPFTIAAFALESGAVSDAIRTGQGWAVLAVRSVEEPRVPTFDEARDEVLEAWTTDRALELAQSRLTADRARLGDGADLEAVAGGYDAPVRETAPFTAAQPVGPMGRAPEVAKAALALEAGAFGGPLRNGETVVLFEVIERVHFDPNDLEAKRGEARQRLETQQVEGLLTAVLDERRKAANVTYDTALLESLGATAEDITAGSQT